MSCPSLCLSHLSIPERGVLEAPTVTADAFSPPHSPSGYRPGCFDALPFGARTLGIFLSLGERTPLLLRNASLHPRSSSLLRSHPRKLMHRQEGTLVQVEERRSIFSPFNSLLSWFSLSSYVGRMASFGTPVKDKLASYIPESGLGFRCVLLTRALPPLPCAPASRWARSTDRSNPALSSRFSVMMSNEHCGSSRLVCADGSPDWLTQGARPVCAKAGAVGFASPVTIYTNCRFLLSLGSRSSTLRSHDPRGRPWRPTSQLLSPRWTRDTADHPRNKVCSEDPCGSRGS